MECNKIFITLVLILIYSVIPAGYVHGQEDYIIVLDDDASNDSIIAGELNPITVRALQSRSLTTCFELESSGGDTFYTSSKIEIGSKVKSNIAKNENGVSNRNFYYIQTSKSETVFTLKTFLRPANITNSCETWSPENNDWQSYEKIVQVITSSAGGDDEDDLSDDDGTSTTTATSTTSTTTTSSTSGSGSSSHSSSAPLSNTNPAYKLEVSAGRSRITTAGNHVAFDAVVTRRDSGREPRFFWTFGDGTSSSGQSVIHSYAFPGTYEVVLNAIAGTDQAVSRTKVSVLTPTVTIRAFNPQAGYIELYNTGSTESNIGEWKILVDGHDFSLPRDTIISVGGTLLLPLSVVTGGETVVGGQVKLRDPQGILLSAYDISSSTIVSATTTIETLAKQLDEMAQQVKVLANKISSPTTSPEVRVPTLLQNNFSRNSSLASVGTTSEILATSSNTTQTAGAIFVVPKPTGWWGSIKNLFVR